MQPQRADVAATMDRVPPLVEAGVSHVEANDGLLRVHSSRGGQTLPALIEAAETSGRTVTDIHLLQPSLESLFVSLTGRKLG